MRERLAMSVLFPILAALTVAVYGGGLGVIFILIYESALGAEGVIVLGMVILIGVPGAAALAQRYLE